MRKLSHDIFYNTYSYGLIMLLLISCYGCVKPITPSDESYKYLYDRSNLRIFSQHYQVNRLQDGLLVSFIGEKDLSNGGVINDRYVLYYAFFENYESGHSIWHDTINNKVKIKQIGSEFLYQFKVKNENLMPGVIMLYVEDLFNGTTTSLDIPVVDLQNEMKYEYAVYKNGLMRNRDFMAVNDTFTIESTNTIGQKELWVSYYSYNFELALPPMITKTYESSGFNVDTVYKIKIGKPLSFSSEGLYLVQEDTMVAQGITFRLEPDYFPEVKKITELIEPLKYISTSEERAKILGAENPKKALDDFWLKLGGSPEMARGLIQRFYHRVEEANAMFTNYKKGWKTDRGMIYLIFGEPDRVEKSMNKEIWIYEPEERKSEEIRFEFVNYPGIFTDKQFVLQRKDYYDRLWYQKVDELRKGF